MASDPFLNVSVSQDLLMISFAELHYHSAKASGGEWNKELLFVVPIDHPEIQRLQGRYKK